MRSATGSRRRSRRTCRTRSSPFTSNPKRRRSSKACRWFERNARLRLEHQFAASHLETAQPPQEAHAEQVAGESAALRYDRLDVAYGDAMHAHAVEHDRGDGGNAVCRVHAAPEVEIA